MTQAKSQIQEESKFTLPKSITIPKLHLNKTKNANSIVIIADYRNHGIRLVNKIYKIQNPAISLLFSDYPNIGREIDILPQLIHDITSISTVLNVLLKRQKKLEESKKPRDPKCTVIIDNYNKTTNIDNSIADTIQLNTNYIIYDYFGGSNLS